MELGVDRDRCAVFKLGEICDQVTDDLFFRFSTLLVEAEDETCIRSRVCVIVQCECILSAVPFQIDVTACLGTLEFSKIKILIIL